MDDDFIIAKLKEMRNNPELEYILSESSDQNGGSEFLEIINEIANQASQNVYESTRKYIEEQINQLKSQYEAKIAELKNIISNTTVPELPITTNEIDIYEAEEIA